MIKQIKRLLGKQSVNDDAYRLKKECPDKSQESYNVLKQERIKDANEFCGLQRSCVECTKYFIKFDDISFIPCSYIKDIYGEYIDSLKNKTLKISDIVKFPYGTKFENIETGTIYIMEQQLKIIKPNGEYDYPAIDKESFEEGYRIVL